MLTSSLSLRICVSLCLLITATSCSGPNSRGAKIVGFTQGGGRSDKKVAYFNCAAIALKDHLSKQGFDPTANPTLPTSLALDAGFQYSAQRDTFYAGNKPDAQGILVHVRQPTADLAALDVSVIWGAEGSELQINEVERNAKVLGKRLGDWWEDYKKQHPYEDFRQ